MKEVKIAMLYGIIRAMVVVEAQDFLLDTQIIDTVYMFTCRLKLVGMTNDFKLYI